MLRALQRARTCAIGFALFSLILPTHVVAQAPKAPAKRPQVHDIQLNAQGKLRVVVVDGQGQRIPQSQIKLTRDDFSASPQSTLGVTNNRGEHTFQKLAGGIYRLETDQGICMCRLWTKAAAPPSASQSLLIVNDTRIARGQRPIREIFRSDPILMTALVAAAIAIPLAIHQSKDKSSGS
ncbi:MAG: hypothetical protein P8N76_01175 [Pirellulaceae bacterium]|nr:hypothetical protein [Pirellulaceae bacterium]